jgi:hypothetical protein
VLASALLLAGFAVVWPAVADAVEPPTSVSLVAAQSSVTIPSSIRLTVSADRDMYGTGYTVAVVDEDKHVTMGPCGQACDLYAGRSGPTTRTRSRATSTVSSAARPARSWRPLAR